MTSRLGKYLMAGIIGAACVAALSPLADAKTLRYSTLVSNQHTAVQDAVLPFFEVLEEKTDGELTGRVFPSEQLLGAREALKGVGDGAADAAMIIPQYNPTELPTILLLADMLIHGNDPLAVAGALNEFMLLDCESCLKEYAEANAFPLANYASTPYLLQCNRPVDSVEDLSGLRVRAAGIMASYLDALGAHPVSFTSPEAVEALERKQIDCTTGPMAWHKSYGLRGSVSYVTDASLGVSRGFGLFVVNTDVWESLPEEQRQAMIEGAPNLVAGIMFGQINEDKSERDYAAETGVEFIAANEELRNSLSNVPSAAEILDDRAEQLGIENMDELVAGFKKKYEKWEKIMSEIGDDSDAYVEALRREVFSKL